VWVGSIYGAVRAVQSPKHSDWLSNDFAHCDWLHRCLRFCTVTVTLYRRFPTCTKMTLFAFVLYGELQCLAWKFVVQNKLMYVCMYADCIYCIQKSISMLSTKQRPVFTDKPFVTGCHDLLICSTRSEQQPTVSAVSSSFSWPARRASYKEDRDGSLIINHWQPLHWFSQSIAGLQSIPGDLKYKDAVAMLVVQTREANEERLAIGTQYGHHDIMCEWAITENNFPTLSIKYRATPLKTKSININIRERGAK